MRVFQLLIAIFILTGASFSALAEETGLSKIKSSYERFVAAQTEETRSDLLTGLASYDGPATVDSVNAHLFLMMHDAPTNNFENIQDSAGLAAMHLAPISDMLPEQYVDARMLYGIAQFNGSFDSDALLQMAHVQGITRTIEDEDGEWAEWAKTKYYEAYAWSAYMNGYFMRREEDPLDHALFDEIFALYPGPDKTKPSETRLPACPGDFNYRPKPRVPPHLARKSRGSSVVLGFDLDSKGRVINLETLAAIPDDAFAKSATKTVSKWKFRPENPDHVGVTCQLEREGVVYPLSYEVGQ